MTNPESARLSGNLTVREVPATWRQFEQLAATGRMPPTIDLGSVERTDSSALALLLEWQAQGSARSQKITFENPPDSLRVIARLTEVSSLLGWNDNKNESDDLS